LNLLPGYADYTRLKVKFTDFQCIIFPNELIKVVELISQAISDINTAAFIETTINDEDPIDTWIAQAKLR